mgnify:CR=1 FL=1
MSDPIVALSMLAIFLFIILLGFPVAFTLMAMGIMFGYYAYFDPDRMWRSYDRAIEKADPDFWERSQLWIDGLFNNRIFDLFVNQTYSVMANDVLTAVPLFLFMGYIVERANIVARLFHTLNIAARHIPGSMAVAALGLIEAVASSQVLSRRAGDRLDFNQEFFGQGLANIAAGPGALFSHAWLTKYEYILGSGKDSFLLPHSMLTLTLACTFAQGIHNPQANVSEYDIIMT